LQHLAIDLGGRESQVCIRDSNGVVLQERKVPTRTLGAFLGRQPQSRVILETCAEAFAIADAAVAAGHEVRVVPATLVRSLGVGSRGVKTDVRDARILSEVSCRIDLPSVHVPSDVARERRMMLTAREQLVSSRTSTINSVRGWSRTVLLPIRSGDVKTFAKRVREAAEKHPNGLPSYIERLLAVIDVLNEQIAAADKELAALTEDDPICQRLMSAPGVGPVTSLCFVAALDEVRRFSSAHAVQSYLGLTPGENSSSERQRRTGITKAGPAMVRKSLVQAAWNIRRLRPQDPMSQWALEIEKRRGKFVATVAVARKLAGVLYAMWRDGTCYDSHHGDRRPERSAA
jgi:transposase